MDDPQNSDGYPGRRLRLRLAHLGGDDAKGGADLRAKRASSCDDADCDQGGDEAILDGRRTRLVLHKTGNEVLHDDTPTHLKLAPTARSSSPLGLSPRG